jgi:hypothetical protein
VPTPFYPDPNADTPRGFARQQIVSTTNATPIKVEVTGHGYGTGDRVEIEGAADPNAAGNWNITFVDANHFTLDGSVGTLAGGAVGTASNWTILPNVQLPSDGDLVDAANANPPVENALNLGAYPGLVNSRWRVVDIYNQRVDDTTPVTNTAWSATTPLAAAYAFAQNNPIWGNGIGESPSINPVFTTGDVLDIEFTTTLVYASAGVLGAIALAVSDNGTNIFPVKGTACVLPIANSNQALTLNGRAYAADFSPAFNAPGAVFQVGVVVYGNAAGPTYTLHGAYSLRIVHYRPNG